MDFYSKICAALRGPCSLSLSLSLKNYLFRNPVFHVIIKRQRVREWIFKSTMKNVLTLDSHQPALKSRSTLEILYRIFKSIHFHTFLPFNYFIARDMENLPVLIQLDTVHK